MPENLVKEVEDIYKIWNKIQIEANDWLVDTAGQLIFTAGGGLTLTFGNKDSLIWRSLNEEALRNSGFVSIANVNFSLKELEMIGDFYRFIRESGYFLHCIDERLRDDLNSINNQVHEHCGACAAVHAVIGNNLNKNLIVEDLLLAELGEEFYGKQNIYDSMKKHVSLAVLINFHGDEAVADEKKRYILKELNALPFQVSLPLEIIDRFIKFFNLDQVNIDLFLLVLVKWNIRIARNIIGGDHNQLQQMNEQTLFIFDERETSNITLLNKLKELIGEVNHFRELVIR